MFGVVFVLNVWWFFNVFNVSNSVTHFGDYEVSLTGALFNDAYRDVSRLLTVPLFLVELLCVMYLPGTAAAVMVALGYPGEIQENQTQRFIWWFMSMMPLCYVVKELIVGLDAATHAPANAAAAGLIANTRYLTVVSWCTLPYDVHGQGSWHQRCICVCSWADRLFNWWHCCQSNVLDFHLLHRSCQERCIQASISISIIFIVNLTIWYFMAGCSVNSYVASSKNCL